jgi:hypothetical protein
MGLHLPLRGFDLLVEGSQDRDQGPGRHRVRHVDHGRLTQLLAAQRGLDRRGLSRAGMSPRRARLSAALI